MSPTARMRRIIGTSLAAACLGSMIIVAPAEAAAGEGAAVSSKCTKNRICFWSHHNYRVKRVEALLVPECVNLFWEAWSIKNNTSRRAIYYEKRNCEGRWHFVNGKKNKPALNFEVRSYYRG
ncbi:peptidase inhibitor family I36 protein [Streptomyces syringium]|uniref:peptidase inhibitor family I36 protein n=1 Tax=Streptomyces syringium TaxID=76729 RepID=UPI003D94434E